MLLLQPLPANLKAVSQHNVTDLISTLFIPFLLFLSTNNTARRGEKYPEKAMEK